MNRSFTVLFALAGISAACSPPPNNNDTVTTDASNDTGMTATLAGSAFCSSVAVPSACTAPSVTACGVCVIPPADPATDRLARTSCSSISDRPEYCDMATPAAAPNLSCYETFDPAHPPTAPMSMAVTVWGVVDVFGTGGDSNNVHVQFFEVGADGSPGAMVGEAISDPAVYQEMAVERDTSGSIVQMRTLAGFKISGIQTDHPYIVKTVGVTTDFFAHAIYDYTVPVRGTDVGMRTPPAALSITGPSVYIRPRTISNSDWVTIPSTATLPTGIPAGHGALAGEVHDCDDVRLANAQVYASPPPNFTSPVYFSDNPTRPLPDTSRSTTGTGALGIYALLDLTPGPLRISAVGYAPDGHLTLVGAYGVRIFPDSVTVASFRGIRPWQYTTP